MQVSRKTLLRLFTYDPNEPFALRWKDVEKISPNGRSGEIAGYWRPVKWGSPTPVRCVCVKSAIVPVHRAVWLYITGDEPPRRLGFRNGDRGDCRIENLIEIKPCHSVVTSKKKQKDEILAFAYKDGEKDWPQINRDNRLRTSYKITHAEYVRMHTAQGGVCAICKRPERMVRHGKLDDLCIDHCHETGVIRGLLCTNCNNGIGRLEDNPNWLRAAADYVEKSRTMEEAAD